MREFQTAQATIWAANTFLKSLLTAWWIPPHDVCNATPLCFLPMLTRQERICVVRITTATNYKIGSRRSSEISILQNVWQQHTQLYPFFLNLGFYSCMVQDVYKNDIWFMILSAGDNWTYTWLTTRTTRPSSAMYKRKKHTQSWLAYTAGKGFRTRHKPITRRLNFFL